jgi:DNA polymerase III delta prime subunit
LPGTAGRGQDRRVQERLALVAAGVAQAAGRRTGSFEPERAARVEAVLAVLAQEYDGVAPPPDNDVLGALGEVFGLDDDELLVLATAAAPDLDANLALALDLLSGRVGSGRVTVGLALEIAGLPTASRSAAELLLDTATLRANGLLEVVGEGGWLGRAVQVPDRIRQHLLGVDDATPDVESVLVDVTPVHGAASTELARAIEAGLGLGYVHAPGSTAGLATAAAAFGGAGWDVLAVDARLVPVVRDDDQRVLPGELLAEVLLDAAREAGLRGRGLVVHGADAVHASPARAATWTALERSPVPVVAVGTTAWDPGVLRTMPLSVPAPLLLAAERRQVWHDALGFDLPVEPGHPPLTGLRMPPEGIVATVEYARTLAASREVELDVATVREAARVLGSGSGVSGSARGAVGGHGPGSSGPAGWDDLVLTDSVLGELQRLARWASYRDDVLARGDVHGKGGKGTGLTALFTGGPGTGKTLAAHVVADELNLDLLQVDLSAVVDKYIGETEKNLERVFREAESRNVVLFFDEADALFGTRTSVQDARDRYANQEVSYLLQRMEQFDGITVLATNLRGNLDPAFSRRMQFIVHFRDPDEDTRRRLWTEHLVRAGGTDEADPVDVDHLAATLEIAGGDIRNVVLAASYDAACEDRTIGMRHVREAAARELHKLGRRNPLTD